MVPIQAADQEARSPKKVQNPTVAWDRKPEESQWS